MRISFYAYDLGPAKNLSIIANEAIQQGSKVCFVGNDKLGVNDLFNPKPDILVTGLSSFQNEEELAYGLWAKSKSIPWVIVADTHRSWGRQTAKGKVSKAIILIASPGEIEEAKKFGYRRIEYLGGPPKWQEFAFIKPASIKKYGKERIVLAGGIKDAAITDTLLEVVVGAMEEIKKEWRLIFKPHPNEAKDTFNQDRRQKILQAVNIIETSAQTDNLLRVVDLSVFTSGATSTIAAAYLRAPVIYYEDKMVRRRMNFLTEREDWFPAESGAVAKAGLDNMTDVIAELFTPAGAAKLKMGQEEAYPLLTESNKRVEVRILDFFKELAC